MSNADMDSHPDNELPYDRKSSTGMFSAPPQVLRGGSVESDYRPEIVTTKMQPDPHPTKP